MKENLVMRWRPLRSSGSQGVQTPVHELIILLNVRFHAWTVRPRYRREDITTLPHQIMRLLSLRAPKIRCSVLLFTTPPPS